MGGGSIVSSSNGIHEDFPFSSLEDEDNGLDFQQVGCADLVVTERKKIDSDTLEKGKKKILSYRPGTWIWKAKGLKVCDYDVPETTCLILVGPTQSGKSSLINRISKVFDDDEFAPARAQVSCIHSINISFKHDQNKKQFIDPRNLHCIYLLMPDNSLRDGTYFLHEYMIPRNSNSICLYDTPSLSDKSHENDKMLKNWMTKGVRDGELVNRTTDNQRLSERLKCKDDKKGFISSKSRKVNYVIYVLNSLSILNAMKNPGGALEARYIKMVVSTFNCPFLSFKDDKPVVVFTHGDLLSISDRARVRAYLGELLGIPPKTQIFDIPGCDDPPTESSIIGMLRHTLEHADRNFPQKLNVMNKVFKISAFLFMILLILRIEFAIDLAQNKSMHQYHVPQPQACSSSELHEMHPNLKFSKKEPEIERTKMEVLEKEPEIEWHKIRHIW